MFRQNFFLLVVLLLVSMLIVACGGETAEDVTTEEEVTTEESEKTTEEEVEEATSGNVVVHADTINSSQVEDAVCVVNSRFEQGWRMVFRASVTDLDTDEFIEDADVKVVLENGEEFEMELGEHGDDGTLLYSVGWTIPEDFPTGSLDYKVVATVDGEEYVYEPFDVELSKLTIIEPTEG